MIFCPKTLRPCHIPKYWINVLIFLLYFVVPFAVCHINSKVVNLSHIKTETEISGPTFAGEIFKFFFKIENRYFQQLPAYFTDAYMRHITPNFTLEGCVLHMYADDIIYASTTSKDELEYRL